MRIELTSCLAALVTFSAAMAAAAPRSELSAPRPSVERPTTPAQTDRFSGRPALFFLPPPTGLAGADDPAICGAHGGIAAGLACKALLPLGRLALVWDYPARADVVGFHVYRVDGAQRILVADQANGAAVRAYVIDPPPADGYATACYAVSAYSTSQESAVSDAFCGAGARLTQTLTLAPIARLTTFLETNTTSSGLNNGSRVLHDTDDRPLVGDWHETDKNSFGDFAGNAAYRLGLYFDITPVMHRRIRSARLQFEVDSAWNGDGVIHAPGPHMQAADVPTDHQTSCAAVLSEGTARWWNYKDWILDSPVKSAAAQGPDIAIDVTDIVNGWANSARPNFGFVLKSDDENMAAFTEKVCVTQYVPASFQLVIQYQ